MTVKCPEFERSNKLIKAIEAQSSFAERSIDIPLSLKAVTDVFEYEEDDVDLRILYQTLTNLSLGFPTAQLDDTTNAFLYGVYKVSVLKPLSAYLKLQFSNIFRNSWIK